jgi:hypothetical protein
LVSVKIEISYCIFSFSAATSRYALQSFRLPAFIRPNAKKLQGDTFHHRGKQKGFPLLSGLATRQKFKPVESIINYSPLTIN